ncbi:hypothetical protein B296_00030412 [Ensete ventricosum]|uniref:Uncharacterized protein n=1 Tax=Ensete ventricosum TaxID=4639 RepID=A0A426ZLV1_ENSVE|nr:hypothetical protein B296_00030412 [Ensete ventricosum]
MLIPSTSIYCKLSWFYKRCYCFIVFFNDWSCSLPFGRRCINSNSVSNSTIR